MRATARGKLFAALALWCGTSLWAEAQATFSFERDIRPLLETHCFDCHDDTEQPKGGMNLERFKSDADVMRDRNVWGAVFEKIESHQMPPPKRPAQLTETERERILGWIAGVAARPDPALGALDPGKPVLRRLTRLEYNNTVRDLLGLDTDVFMFSERLPLADKSYFQPASGKMGDRVEVRLREYGGRYPVLLPQSGLPPDSRAEHGFRNRGDAMNFSPVQLEQYVALAGEIVNHPDLPRRSAVFAGLLGESSLSFSSSDTANKRAEARATFSPVALAAREFAPKLKALRKADGSADNYPEQFRETVREAAREGRGGVFDAPDTLGNQTIAGKGGLIKVDFGGPVLAINPNEDLWLAGFATTEAASGAQIIANKTKGAKMYELTFAVRDGEEGEGVARLGVCVLGRKGHSGTVTLKARFTDDTARSLTAPIAEGPAGTTFFSFAAHPGETIKTLLVDGSRFSGDYVILDDIGFVTTGRVRESGSSFSSKENPTPPAVAVKKQEPRAEARATLSPRERLSMFMERAFRRPVGSEEASRYHTLFEQARKSGKSEADAMRAAVQAVLASPSFLFLAEARSGGNAAEPVRALDDYELASRLSFFLWASMPDEELFALARAGKLREPAVLKAQARRMLRDPKARELSESFAVQWLRLDQLFTSQPDRGLFKAYYSGPQGKDTLHGAQLIEALLLFETVMVEDRGILDFVDADYTWLNPRLAKVYGLGAEPGSVGTPATLPDQPNRELKPDARNANNRWQRVPLEDNSRGGFLTMGGPLTVTSLPFRTSPVKRGAWLLETIFNRPPQEPKVAFVIENDTKEAAATQSIRQKFEAHRDKAACYTCHIRLDPPGFALERFDPIGVWRELDGGQPVDAGGEWHGRPFDGPAGFKSVLMEKPEEFTRGFIEHLLSYALGRELEVFDMPVVAEIQRAAASDGYRFSRVVEAIAASYPFRFTRTQATAGER